MARSHSITCAYDDCPEWSTVASLKPATREQIAAEHRARLAVDGWTDFEGRDYCPDHTPTGVAR
ncbi:hypothetical protein ABT186_01750 [Streptomyces sp. NPDC001634]|uniref:hypothetical protein n=1 Tax=Streptomyces sp. NPDC001634 TaxID=3154390 RepID=UPI003320DFDE